MQTQKLATQLYSQYPAPSMLLQTTNMLVNFSAEAHLVSDQAGLHGDHV